jgi:hypothetical protein
MIKNLFLALIALVSSLLLAEVAMRVMIHFADKPILGYFNILDDKLGWRTTENYKYERWLKDRSGHKYWVKATTNEFGFRLFGNINTNRKKVMFIGDSFTHAMEVSDDKTYFSIISKVLPLEIFAYGSLGYGNLQEYMIVDKYIDFINPDILVIQLTCNDIVDNSYELDGQSDRYLHATSRPYLTEDGQLIKLNPRSNPFLWETAREYSVVLYRLLVAIQRTKEIMGLSGVTIEDEIVTEGPDHPGFKRASLITNKLFAMIKKRSAQRKIFAFIVDDVPPFYGKLKEICRMNNIEIIEGITDTLSKAENVGLETKAYDDHWNELGHKIVADVIIEHIRRSSAIDK